MNNEIEVKLIGSLALDYVRNERLNDSAIDALQLDFDELRKKLDKANKELEFEKNNSNMFKTKYKKLLLKQEEDEINKSASSKLLSDTEKGKQLDEKRGFSKKDNIKDANIKKATKKVKHKTKLYKQDMKDFDELANQAFRSKSSINHFADTRNLSHKTVYTYINKHSEGKYKVVQGKDIKDYQVWNNAKIYDEIDYFTVA